MSHGDGDPADDGSGGGSERGVGGGDDPESRPASDSGVAGDADRTQETAADAGDSRDGDADTEDGPGGDADADVSRDAAGDADGDSDAEPESAAAGYAVPTETGSDAETAWLRALAEAGELTPDAVEAMLALHDDRGGRAIEAVSEGRVKQYRDFTVVVGHEDEYVVENGGCTCKDTAYNLDPEDPHERCWHVLAVAIAERIGEVDHHEMWYSEVRDFI